MNEPDKIFSETLFDDINQYINERLANGESEHIDLPNQSFPLNLELEIATIINNTYEGFPFAIKILDNFCKDLEYVIYNNDLITSLKNEGHIVDIICDMIKYEYNDDALNEYLLLTSSTKSPLFYYDLFTSNKFIETAYQLYEANKQSNFLNYFIHDCANYNQLGLAERNLPGFTDVSHYDIYISTYQELLARVFLNEDKLFHLQNFANHICTSEVNFIYGQALLISLYNHSNKFSYVKFIINYCYKELRKTRKQLATSVKIIDSFTLTCFDNLAHNLKVLQTNYHYETTDEYFKLLESFYKKIIDVLQKLCENKKILTLNESDLFKPAEKIYQTTNPDLNFSIPKYLIKIENDLKNKPADTFSSSSNSNGYEYFSNGSITDDEKHDILKEDCIEWSTGNKKDNIGVLWDYPSVSQMDFQDHLKQEDSFSDEYKKYLKCLSSPVDDIRSTSLLSELFTIYLNICNTSSDEKPNINDIVVMLKTIILLAISNEYELIYEHIKQHYQESSQYLNGFANEAFDDLNNKEDQFTYELSELEELVTKDSRKSETEVSQISNSNLNKLNSSHEELKIKCYQEIKENSNYLNMVSKKLKTVDAKRRSKHRRQTLSNSNSNLVVNFASMVQNLRLKPHSLKNFVKLELLTEMFNNMTLCMKSYTETVINELLFFSNNYNKILNDAEKFDETTVAHILSNCHSSYSGFVITKLVFAILSTLIASNTNYRSKFSLIKKTLLFIGINFPETRCEIIDSIQCFIQSIPRYRNIMKTNVSQIEIELVSVLLAFLSLNTTEIQLHGDKIFPTLSTKTYYQEHDFVVISRLSLALVHLVTFFSTKCFLYITEHLIKLSHSYLEEQLVSILSTFILKIKEYIALLEPDNASEELSKNLKIISLNLNEQKDIKNKLNYMLEMQMYDPVCAKHIH